jgi:hypothetical protein
VKKLLLTLSVLVLSAILFSSKVDAAVLDKTNERSYVLKEDSVEIREVKTFKVNQPSWYIPAGSEEIFYIFNPIENDPNQKDKIDRTLKSLVLTDSFGESLNFNSETITGGSVLIKLRTPRNIIFGESYKIELKYTAYGLILKNGVVKDFYLPAFSKDYKFETENTKETVTTEVKIPKTLGEINFVAPDLAIEDQPNERVIRFPQERLVGESGWIQIGINQNFNFSISQPYKATSNISFLFNTYKLILPRNIVSGYISQEVFYGEISPTPYYVEKDLNENLVAYFKVPSNESGEIKVNGYATIKQNKDVNFAQSGVITDISSEILKNNTAPGKFWESSSIEIQQVARDLKGSETDVFKILNKTYQYVIDKIDYSDVKRFGINNRQGALETLRGGAAVCMEYADLFIALMRAQGIPARAAFGHAYSALDYASVEDKTINHQWAEIYIPSINSWIPVDTTWGENGRAVIGGDLNRFYLHVASVDPETPSPTEVTFYGNIGTIPENITTVTAADSNELDQSIQISAEQLLNMYPKKGLPEDLLYNLTSGFLSAIQNINTSFNQSLMKIVPGASPSIITAIKTAIVFLVSGAFIVIILKVRQRRLKNSMRVQRVL